MKLLLISCVVFFAAIEIKAAPALTLVPAATLEVWPDGKMPGHGAAQPETDKRSPKGQITSITNVSVPSLELFPTPGQAGPRPAMIICPGGGYHQLSYLHEGADIAAWLNGLGITGIVLKYRIPDNRDGTLQDVERAMRMVRSHATDWKIDPQHVGVIGFSAGGHLAARLSTSFGQPSYPVIDAADILSCRPDFTILLYPAYLGVNGQVAPELTLSPEMPPLLIIQAQDDARFIVGTKLFEAAMTKAHLPHLFLLYPDGGHGFALHSTKSARVWPEEARKWLKKNGVL